MKNKKVLICDDDYDNLNISEFLLEFEGYIVIKEIDSTNLINKVNENNPDILLVDMWMPVLCGDGIIKIIRVDSKNKEFPIIAFSASYESDKAAIEAGENHYISKPFNIDEFTKLISKLVS